MTFSRTGSQDTTQKDAYLHFELPSVPSGTVLPLAGIARNYHASFSHRLGRNCQRKHSYFRGFGDGKTFFHEIVSKIPEAIANLVTHSQGLYWTSLPPQFVFPIALFKCGGFEFCSFCCCWGFSFCFVLLFFCFVCYELPAEHPCYLPTTFSKTR